MPISAPNAWIWSMTLSAVPQQQARLQVALRQLPMADRSALALVYVHELALADVARC